jgi:phospholipase/carboxylesterase
MSAFVHRFEPGGHEARPLLLLHGTGGDESDLIPLGQEIAPGAALLSPRGKVLEHGMPRFFRRLAEGVFDEDDVRRRADELADFVDDARKRYGLAAPIALGYSNGANIAAAVLLRRPQTLSGAILLRAMVPLEAAPRPDLGGKSVLIISGAQDPIVPAANAARLAALLRDAGATVEHRVRPIGHGLSNEDVALARQWMREVARLWLRGRDNGHETPGPVEEHRHHDALESCGRTILATWLRLLQV